MAISDISVNNIIIAREVASSGSVELNGDIQKFRKRYNDKQDDVERRFSELSRDAGTGQGLTADAANRLASLAQGVTPSLTRTTLTLPGPPPYEVGSNEVQASGTFVTSIEELEYDMGSATREISEIIVHWSETFSNANLTGAQAKSLGGGSYHYIIKRDGSIERDVPIQSAAGHTPGHNSYSIGVLLIGGVAAATEDQGLAERVGAGNITRSQFNSLYQIMRAFYTQYPGGQALGHSEVDPSQNDPGFEVRDYAYNLFNKSSLFADEGELKTEKSPDEINQPEDPEGPNVLDKDTELLDQKF